MMVRQEKNEATGYVNSLLLNMAHLVRGFPKFLYVYQKVVAFGGIIFRCLFRIENPWIFIATWAYQKATEQRPKIRILTYLKQQTKLVAAGTRKSEQIWSFDEG